MILVESRLIKYIVFIGQIKKVQYYYEYKQYFIYPRNQDHYIRYIRYIRYKWKEEYIGFTIMWYFKFTNSWYIDILLKF